MRELRGLSQRELARRCRLADVMMNRYETRGIDPTTTTLKLIAENLNVSADYLLGLTNDPQGKLMESDLNRNERDLVDAYRRGGSFATMRFIIDQMENVSGDDKR